MVSKYNEVTVNVWTAPIMKLRRRCLENVNTWLFFGPEVLQFHWGKKKEKTFCFFPLHNTWI